MEHTRELIAYAERWLPYDGGDAEDILVEFGLPEHEFFSRVLAALPTADVDATTKAAIETVASHRIRASRDFRTNVPPDLNRPTHPPGSIV